MNVQTLYYLEITSEDIEAAAVATRELSRSRTCPISQAMKKIFQEIILSAENWTGFFNSLNGKWQEFSGHNDCIRKFINNVDNDLALPTILLLEKVPSLK